MHVLHTGALTTIKYINCLFSYTQYELLLIAAGILKDCILYHKVFFCKKINMQDKDTERGVFHAGAQQKTF